ncbi:MAG TPA: class I SAM-dependent methyltransferase [Candidatus Paceibacterota bacterium]
MFSAPEKNIEQFGLGDNKVVADFGAGSGMYILAAAKAMHGTGKVYAVDVQKDLLTRLQNTCKEAHLGNVSFIWGDLEKPGGTKLRDDSCDAVILSNILFQVPDKRAVLEEAKRVLHTGGKLLVIDWTASFNNMGPTKEQVFALAPARKLLDESGFVFDRDINAGNFHYGLVMKKRGLRTHEVTVNNIV